MAGLSFRRADLDDLELLLEWRNDPDTVKNSFGRKKISGLEHLQWMYRALTGNYCDIYIAVDDCVPVGTVRLDAMHPETDKLVSITVAPIARGKGYGSRILSFVSAAEPDRELVALVKNSNKASISIFTKAGFAEVGSVGSGRSKVLTFRRAKLLL